MNRPAVPEYETWRRKLRIRVVAFLTEVVLFVSAFDAAARAMNTIRYLDFIERERDQWQRPWDVISLLDVKDGSKVAEVGSGSGYFALKLSRVVGQAGEVVAVDVRRLPLAFLWARSWMRHRSNLRFQVTPADDPRLPIGALDAVLIANTYHEFSRPDLILRHVRAALRIGGRLVVLDHSAAPEDTTEATEHAHGVAAAKVAGDLRAGGFELADVQDGFITRPTGERWWLMLARKSGR